MSRWLECVFEPRMPLWRYVLWAFPVSFIPGVGLAAAAVAAATAMGFDIDALSPDAQSFQPLSTILLGPAIETLLLAATIRLLRLWLTQPLHMALASGLVWGVLHGLIAPLWFFAPAWSFVVYATAWMAWRPKGWLFAFIAAATTHALHNAAALALMSLG